MLINFVPIGDIMSEREREPFYYLMKSVVVRIQNVSEINPEDVEKFVGVVISEEGFIVTTNKFFGKDFKGRTEFCYPGEEYVTADVIEHLRQCGLVLLAPRERGPIRNHVEFGGRVSIGQDILSFVYPSRHLSLLSQRVTHPLRLMGDIKGDLDSYDQYLADHLHLIELNRTIPLGGYGGPVMNQNGILLGLLLFNDNTLSYAVHFVHIHELLEKWKERKQRLEKEYQIKRMELEHQSESGLGDRDLSSVVIGPMPYQPSGITEGGGVTDAIQEIDKVSTIPSWVYAVNSPTILPSQTLQQTDSLVFMLQDQVEESARLFEVGTLLPPTLSISSSSVAAAVTSPGTDSQAPKEETQVPESVSTLYCEHQQLSNTNIHEVPSSKTLDECSKAEIEHSVSEIQSLQQAHTSALKASLDVVLQDRKKTEEIAEKMTSLSVRAPLKSFLAEPIFGNWQEATALGDPKLPTYEDGSICKAQAKTVPTMTSPESSTNTGLKNYTGRDGNSPAKLSKKEQKKRVRWPPFRCCLYVASDRANLVGAH